MFFTKIQSFLVTSLAIMLTCMTGLSWSAQIELPATETALEITHQTQLELDLRHTLEALDVQKITLSNSQTYTELNIAGFGTSAGVGAPQVPVLHQLIEVPYEATINVTITRSEYTEIDLNAIGFDQPVRPLQPPRSKSDKDHPFVMETTAYQENDWAPRELVTTDILGMMRDVRLARLNIAPVQYNPVSHVLRIYHDIEIMVRFDGANLAAMAEEKRRTASPYFNSIQAQVLNAPPNTTRDTITNYPVTYIIVADPMFEATLQPFVEWKTRKGFTVIEAYTDDPSVGSSTSSIQSYLENLYTTLDPAPSFVLFVGDVDQIPAFDGNTGSHVSDLHYCDYTGDYLPEVYYGRFSATSVSQLQPQIDKTLEYEQYLMSDPDFLNEVVMISGVDASFAPTHGNGQINYGTTYYMNADHGLTSHTYLYPASGGSDVQIRQDVSNGVAFANYTAHGSSNGWADPTFSVSQVADMTNAGKYPLMVGNACLTNKFDVSVCFGEALLRAENKGAVGYIGGSNSTYWDEDFWWGVGLGTVTVNPTYDETGLGAYDRTFHDHGEPESEWFVTQGSMINAGNLAVTASSSSLINYYWEIYHLMGDPSLMIYFSEPPTMAATYNAMLPMGLTSFTVNTEPGAYVGLSMDGVLYSAALADESGLATLNFDPFTSPGTADVVITKQNRQPHLGTVTIAPADGAYVVFAEATLTDPAGNNNGQADFGEAINLTVSLENPGQAAANSVTALLSSADSYISISDASEDYGTISAGQTATRNDAFAVAIADDIPDQHAVLLDLTAQDGTGESWESSFNFTVSAPALLIGGMIIQDSAGNNNGRLDPGETATLLIETSNEGHAVSPAATGLLTTSSPGITVTAGTHDFGTIGVNSTETASFTINVAADAGIGQPASFFYEVTAGSYTEQTTFPAIIGLVMEDFETGDFSRFDWEHAGDADWEITSQNPYNGSFSAMSGDINDNDSSELSVELTVLQDGEISFWRKVSSESNYDYLRFYIDGDEKGEWAGEVAWSQVSFAVTAGTHTFKWAYEKDYSVSNGSDCAWLDDIIFPAVGSGSSAPNMSISPVSLNFGNVAIGESDTRTFTVSNTGNAPLVVSAINSNQSVFTVEPASFSVNPAASQQVTVTFAPTTSGAVNGQLTVLANDPDSPSQTVAVQGNGTAPPEIQLDPVALSENLEEGQTAVQALTIENTGGSVLTISVTLEEATTARSTDAGLSLASHAEKSRASARDKKAANAGLSLVSNRDAQKADGNRTRTEPAWLSINPNVANINPGGNTSLAVTFDATDLTAAVYEAQLIVTSNDPSALQTIVPVTLTVNAAAEPPVEPSDLVATASASDAIDLSWTDQADNEAGFRLERRQGTSGNFNIIATLAPNTEQYSDDALQAETQYCYRIYAFNDDGNSDLSNIACATTEAIPVPAAPANLTATANDTHITLTWDDMAAVETGYVIERREGSSGNFTEINTVEANVESYSDQDIDEGQAYCYRVRAYNGGGFSEYSNIACETLPISNQPPEATSQQLTVLEDTPLNITLSGFDPEGTPLTYEIVTMPQHGVLSGTVPDLIYQPDSDFFGLDEFSFHVSDGVYTSPTAQITINVTPVNDAPTLTIVEPDGVDDYDVDSQFQLVWTDSDVDDNATVTFYWDSDDTGADGFEITSITEDDGADTWLWDTSDIPLGDYYVYGIIADDGGLSQTVYSPHPVHIMHCPMGDVDGNRENGMADVMLLNKIILGLMDPTPAQLFFGDMNGDGLIDIQDLLLLMDAMP